MWLLVDLVSSNEEGFEFLRQLQESPPATFTLVTALTDKDNTVDKLRAFDLGVCDCIGKPFDALVFRARLRALLETKRRHDDLGRHNDSFDRGPSRRRSGGARQNPIFSRP